ncbi:MAG: hypothetical protein LBJ16_02340 [Holosporaceae bacterium]|nr:hypothetical protein [Holosporaceae bacterium]
MKKLSICCALCGVLLGGAGFYHDETSAMVVEKKVGEKEKAVLDMVKVSKNLGKVSMYSEYKTGAEAFITAYNEERGKKVDVTNIKFSENGDYTDVLGKIASDATYWDTDAKNESAAKDAQEKLSRLKMFIEEYGKVRENYTDLGAEKEGVKKELREILAGMECKTVGKEADNTRLQLFVFKRKEDAEKKDVPCVIIVHGGDDSGTLYLGNDVESSIERCFDETGNCIPGLLPVVCEITSKGVAVALVTHHGHLGCREVEGEIPKDAGLEDLKTKYKETTWKGLDQVISKEMGFDDSDCDSMGISDGMSLEEAAVEENERSLTVEEIKLQKERKEAAAKDDEKYSEAKKAAELDGNGLRPREAQANLQVKNAIEEILGSGDIDGKRVTLVGHSIGGSIISSLIDVEQTLINKLQAVVLYAPGIEYGEGRSGSWKKAINSMKKGTVAAEKWPLNFASVKPQVYIFQGTADVSVLPESMLELMFILRKANLPKLKLVWFEDCVHGIHLIKWYLTSGANRDILHSPSGEIRGGEELSKMMKLGEKTLEDRKKGFTKFAEYLVAVANGKTPGSTIIGEGSETNPVKIEERSLKYLWNRNPGVVDLLKLRKEFPNDADGETAKLKYRANVLKEGSYANASVETKNILAQGYSEVVE